MAAEFNEESSSNKSTFICSNCGFECHYEYFGKTPPFSKSIVLLEDAYVIRDPFSSSAGHLTLGGQCFLCSGDVCVSQRCSIFYTKRFCIACVEGNMEDFPKEIQKEIQQKDIASN
ncbi:cysteine-rich DPF motif domain-containing protein 1-like [Montipora foliosa]|uniref:cysteine-rich DPF motif domain-containing protein 1-like n=1 Tax=Montipora foliosa TaxID=591990 RepID=UPI0035F11C17